MSASELDMIAATNAARAVGRTCGSYGYFAAAPPLIANTRLAAAAQAHADDMATNDFFSHTGSDGSGFTERIDRTGYSWSRAAENMAGQYEQPAQAVAALLESPDHCRSIMDPALTEIGVGFSSSSAATYQDYWVQEFAAPM